MDGKEFTLEELEAMAEALLNEQYWPRELQADVAYERPQDDNDGNPLESMITVVIDPRGDAHISAGPHRMIRFRMRGGGGMSPRVRTALVLLALAIKKDNEERPLL